MKKIVILTSICLLMLSCAPGSEGAKLAKLKAKREALDKEIKQLEAGLKGKSQEVVITERTTSVQVSQVLPAEFNHFIQIKGSVESDNNIMVPPQSPGVVQKIHVKRGDSVSKGQLLAQLDASVLKSSIDEVKHGLELATTIFERQSRLWQKKIGSEIAYLQAKNNKESLEKRLKTLKEQHNLTRIESPISGHVDEILIKEGEAAAAGFGAFRIVQLSKLKIRAFLAENHITQVKRGDAVDIYIPSLSLNFQEPISSVSNVIDAKERTFTIEINIPKKYRDIKLNMITVLTINDYRRQEALTVPLKVIQKTGNDEFLFVAVQNGTKWQAQKRTVKSGLNYDDRVEIEKGLQSGEYVVTFGFQGLADGQPITISDSQFPEAPAASMQSGQRE